MIIKELEVANLRAYEQAAFGFQRGMNLVIGFNGVGKSTLLDAVRICLAKIIQDLTVAHIPRGGFDIEDIRLGAPNLKARATFDYLGIEFELLVSKQRRDFAESYNEKNKTVPTPDINKTSPGARATYASARELDHQPIALYFSTRRALITERDPGVAADGQAAAYTDALVINRNFNIRDIANYLVVLQALAMEDQLAGIRLRSVLSAANRFLPHYGELSVTKENGTNRLLIDKSGQAVYVNWLSDGEKSMLSMALEIAKRLAIANPGLQDPIKDGTGIVLIDELDLHLHPKWQRTVVKQLTDTFPNLQFIATTHSPQIIPSVEPEAVQIITSDRVIYPDRTLGMDTNWILRYIMETDAQPAYAVEAIATVERLIDEGNFEAARSKIAESREEGYDLTVWPVLEARMARFEIFEEE